MWKLRLKDANRPAGFELRFPVMSTTKDPKRNPGYLDTGRGQSPVVTFCPPPAHTTISTSEDAKDPALSGSQQAVGASFIRSNL